VQYADFAVWQREWLQGEVLEAQLSFWKERLAGAPRLLELPTDRPRPAVQTYNGAALPAILPPALSDAVRELCRREGVTPFMALLAAWAVVLGRHAGQEDVLVGSPIAGRNRREIEDLIGFFVNTLVFRIELAGDFGKLLRQVQQTALDAYSHQDLPFEQIVEAVVQERDLSHSPLFQVLFALQNAPAQPLRLPGLSLTLLAVDSGVTKFDLSLTLGEGPDGFSGGLEHNTDLFDGTAAARFLARFEVLLAAAVADPGLAVLELPLLLETERQQVLLEWNQTEAPLAGPCLHELFAWQAARTPQAAALVHDNLELTYAELASRAGGLARCLRRLKVRPEARVAVCLERSPDLIATLLGVLAAGGAYVPIDPKYPEERRAFMLEDSGAEVLVTRTWTWEVGREGLRVLDLDAAEISEAKLPLERSVTPGHLAYIIYTSGSTGRPKGVAIEHRSAVALAGWARETFSAEELSGVLAATSVCFDLSVFEIFAPLAWGGTVILAQNALELPTLPAASAVRLLNTVPSAATELVRSGGLPAGVRTVCLAGEPLPAALAARLYETGTVERVLDLYGPSEDTTYSTGALVPRQAERAPAIGRPLPGTRAYVVDPAGRPVPAGMAGELWLAGAGLARGYLGRPELTAERFTPDPWSGEAGSRVYRTGDLVLFRPDGELDFLSRIDFQVKVRGFRIELGEVEAALRSYPEVRDCVVVVRDDVAGSRLLVAYVVGERKDLTDALRSFLGERLPEYMVPSAWVFLDALPLTPTGKVDRKALPAPERRADESIFVAPRDAVEETLAGIWREVLRIDLGERVGVYESFFTMGGHSLLATQVISRIREALGVDLPLRVLFARPTIGQLAEEVRAVRWQGVMAPPLAPVPRSGELPLSFAQQRLWLIDRLVPGNPAYNIPLAVRLDGELSVGLLEKIFTAIVRRHEALRTTFAAGEGGPVQVIHADAQVELPVIDLSGLTERSDLEAREIALEEARRPFDLQRGPLLRTLLVRLGAAEHILLLNLHHIVTDGWSMGVLLREITALYDAFSQGRPSPLPELPVQYADFAVWQRDWLQGEVLERQISFWKNQLAGAPQLLELPTDRPRPAVQTFRGASRPELLPPALSGAVRDLCRSAGVTPFMALLAAWALLLGRTAGQDDVLVGAPVAGRNRREIEDLIGFFVNTLVLRTWLRGGTFRELLAQVRAATLDAFAHQDVPFERLVEELAGGRDLSRSPLFQVAFALQNAPAGRLAVPGLSLAPVAVDSGLAKFDVTLTLAESASGFSGSLEHNVDLFDGSTAERLWTHFSVLLEAAVDAPGLPLTDLPLLLPAERHQTVLEWNDTAETFCPDRLMQQLFEERVDAQPEAPAVLWEEIELSYAELEARANRLAHLLASLGAGRGTPVAVWMERSHHMLAAVLGILKAGGCYVPLDAAWPAQRVETILAGTGAPVIVADRRTLPAVDEMRWRLPLLADTVCPEMDTPEPEPETLDASAVRALWDFVAERATDEITAGGFVSSFTGLPFAAEEVDEYRDRVLSLAAPWLRPGARALEVGCGSGLIFWEMARQVDRCAGVDPSKLTQERNRERARLAGLGSVDLRVGFAHEIGGMFAAGSFDLVVLASAVQFFPGPRYLERVVADALRLLAPGGALLVADVMDARREGELRRALEAAGAPAKQGARELWLDEDLFRDVGAALPEAGAVEILHRTAGFANELGYRYDVVIRRGGDAATASQGARRKRSWTGWHVERAAAARPPACGAPEDLAYVIHTSGSTGIPKGIAVQHAPAVRLIRWVNRTFGVGPDDRLLFVTSLCFDLSVYDIFGALAAGGTVRVAPEAALRDAEQLVRLLREEPITMWDSAPATLQQLAPWLPPQPEERPLRLVLLSGDWIPVRLPDAVRAAFPGARVVSLGGATEATVWSNWFAISEVDPVWTSIPYGRPIANARYHVLDSRLQPCPIGVSGDLYIGGECLCVGYTGQPELTAERFLPDPFSPQTGMRLFRTGDRARTWRDGNLEFLGRIDHQVKVRGFRIELGEIEATLLRHPAVREAVAIVREDAPGDRMLTAYMVPREGGAPDAAALRAWLAERLPAYMVPAACVVLESLPTTANGKLDRQVLPVPERGWLEEGSYAAPSDPVEEMLAGLFAEVLRLERIGVHDDFFSLGGHSLLATQVISRIRVALGVTLPLRTLFEAPTVATLARRVRSVRQTAPPVPSLAPVPQDPRRGDLPLSFAQQRLWVIDQLEPGNPAYNVYLAVRLTGELAPGALERTLAEVVRRHEVLRTTFAAGEDGPVQVIAPPERAPQLPLIDLSDLPDRADLQARQIALAEARWLFDLRRGPLLRLLLVRLATTEHLLLLTLHHIITDGWSMGVLLREIAALYEAFVQGRPSPLPELPMQYADYAVWQRGWLQGHVLAAQLDFWKSQLAGAPAVLELPLDRPRPAAPTWRGAARSIALGPALSESVRKLCRQQGATPFMALLAAWAVLLGRHAGQDDVLVGSPIAGRTRRETEDLIGFFVNTLVLRIVLNGEAPSPRGSTFAVIVEQARRTALDAFTHQDLPFERLVEEIVSERNLAIAPLFQVLFVLQNAPQESLTVPGLSFSPVAVEAGLAKLDLTLSLGESPDGISGTLEYSTDLFDRSTAERLLARFAILLEAAVADPTLPIADLPLLLPAERQQMLREWSDQPWIAPREASFPELFAAAARAFPEEPAVVSAKEEVWSYRRLDEASNRLARRLRALGVGLDEAVGLCMERSPELILGVVAVLKAGGVYVPLNPAHPDERLLFQIEDTGARVVLVHAGTRDRLPEHRREVDSLICETGDATPLGLQVPAESLCYVIYTSGSTGVPKGVGVPHGAAMLHSRVIAEDDGLGPGERVIQFSSLSFDVSLEQMLSTLISGAAVVLRGEELDDPRNLQSGFSRLGITSANLPTAYWHQAVQEWSAEASLLPLCLRVQCVGGEAMLPEAARRWVALAGPLGLGGVRLINGYGPTETVVTATRYTVDSVAPKASSVPIGRLLPFRSGSVIDPRGSLQPVGVPGELCLGGILARGYVNRPDLTAERFLPDPFSEEPGSRMYRTGDLVRALPDGNLDYLGRIDRQVKIRGFRIEPGEIEAVLSAHPAVRDCAVMARQDTPGDTRLVAYVVLERIDPTAPSDPRARLSAWLRERLPDFMMPAAFMFLEALPLTPNGKVDRRALPRPDRTLVPGESFVVPRDEIELRLARIWEELLDVRPIGVHDNFFVLGGHSLLATRVATRVRGTLGVELPLRTLFEAPTIADLARAVREARPEGAVEEVPPIVPVPRGISGSDLPLSFAQQRLWFLDQLNPQSPAYNIPLGVRLTGALRPAALAAALCEIVHRHEALRTCFPAVAGQPAQVMAEFSAASLPLIDLAGLPEPSREDELRRLARAEALRPFDLCRGPLLRTTLVRSQPEAHAVLVTMHHIISDGWSMGVFLGELVALYTAVVQGRPSPFPELAVQYADYAAWQRAWLSGERLEAEIAWWKQRLAGVPTALELPTDRPRQAQQRFRGTALPVSLPPEIRDRLTSLGRAAGATPFMVLLAMFQSLLGRWSGQDDFVVGTPIAGRLRAETEPLIGFFVNTLALRAELADDPSFRALLERVRDTALDAYAHQELPFERLVAEIQPERDLSRNALVQVLLAVQNTPVQTLSAEGLTFEPLAEDNETAKVDLSLHLSEQGERIEGLLSFSTDLFETATVARLVGHFEHLLAAALTDPDCRLSDLSLLTPAELHQLVYEAASASTPPDQLCIHQLFAKQVARTPEALAVFAEEDGKEVAWTYAELGRRVRRLAARLRALGVDLGRPVLLCAERGAGLVAGLFGILEAGGAYLAVEPDLPRARLELLAGDADAAVAVTERPLAGALPAGIRRIFLEDLEADADPPPGAISSGIGPGHLAYVLYTSGSTGRPKGVMVEHRQLAAYVQGVVERLGLPSGASFATVSSFAADLGNTSIFAALLNGGCLHVVSRERLADAAALAALMERRPVDGLKIVPSHLTALLTAERPERVLPRRLLVLGGEPLPWSLVERVRALSPELRVLNHYGPTETTVGVLAGEVQGQGGGASAPLGRPLGFTRARVMDRHGQLLPIGVPGELCVGGPQVTRGYLGRPDLTAERFVPDPYGDGGERLYRTGDLVRRRPDGAIEFLGRIDDQVKIRGFRVELAEVEAALLALPEVCAAAALVRDRANGDRSLAAFVAVAAPVAASELLSRLREQLPAALVPSNLGLVDTLPRTPNGKVDRKALAALLASSASEHPAETAEDGASDPVTQLLAGLWADVLGLPQVQPDDDFFAIGGHSLLATRVVSRVREACAVELPLRSLFEARTPERLAAVVREARRSGAGRQTPPLVPVPRRRDLPLSFAQQRLWFLAQLEPDSPAYNVPMPVLLRGFLDVPALEAALRAIERRHEVLRTIFATVEGEAVQRIGAAPCLDLPLIDLAALPAPVRQPEVARLARAEALRPFDLAAGPVWRAGLVRLAADQHAVLITLHHIASDAWSRGILLRELGTLYGSLVRREPSSLPVLPIQYADFAVWQRGWLQGGVLEEQIEHWRRRLAGAPRVLELPTDRPRPAMQTFSGAATPLALPPALSQGIAALCRQAGATPFMALLAAWTLLLGRHAGQEDVLVGTPIAGRSRREVEDLIGFFINTLVLRSDLSGSPAFGALLGRVREAALDAYAHQDVPFERLVEALVSERDLAVSPLFQTLFVLQNAPAGELRIRGIALEPLEVRSEVAKLDLGLALTETSHGIAGVLEHNTDLFDATTAARLAARFAALLEAAVADPDRSVDDLAMLLPQERSQLLLEWNDTGEAPLPECCLHELFAAQAARTPHATALVHRTCRWPYAELAARAGGIARRLRTLGVGPEIRVAVCLERSPDLIAALLGVLASGGTYVPIDPAYPPERRALMLEDSGSAVLVTRATLAPLGGEGLRVLDLDAEKIPSAELPGEAPVNPHHLAYVIYTSGSTGRPKGVAIEHRSAAALAGWARGELSQEELSGVLAATSICFDLSVFEIFMPLAWGGTVYLAENALELPTLPAAAGVRLLNTVPSAAAELVRAGGVPPSVRTVALAGEPLPASLVEQLYATGSVERVLNLYGPSEDTTYSTAARVRRGGTRGPAIGRPLPGTRAYVVDLRGRPVPLGVAGELWLAGAGLARGYLGRPELTAERFTPDPFGSAGERVYRTGDLVRFRPADDPGLELEFLGRIDHQVKIRGFRIELGEVEAVLRSHPAVRDCVVDVREEGPGDRRLIAWTVLERPEPALAEALREKLPAYMVPSAFVSLEQLPLLPNGKVDRRALPAPGRRSEGFEPPRDEIELRLARLWEDLLNVRPVGIHDNFFALGGHSLLVVRLMGSIERLLGRRLPVSALMEAPTVAQMASLVRREAGLPRSLLVPIQPGVHPAEAAPELRPPLYLVHPVGGNVLCYVPLAQTGTLDGPLYGLQAPGHEELTEPWTIETMAERYLAAIREIQPEGPYMLAGWSLGGVVAFEMARQLEAQGSEAALVAMIDPGPPRRGSAAPDTHELDELAAFAFDLRGLAGLDTSAPLSLPRDVATLDALLANNEVRALLPPDLSADHLRQLFALHRANRRALEAYRPHPYGGRITLLRAAASVALSPETAQAWSDLAAGGLDVHILPGDHYALLRAPHVGTLAERLAACAGRALDQADREAAGLEIISPSRNYPTT